ncbi:general secretion pathway protein GspL [Arthrobacter sp. TPD3018]|uniref:type II secretion system protein GspL n=1 Tax=Bacteria TaxID=2 RepID=UPI000D517FFE|nr:MULTISPECIES: type II secretion system protein GspL [Bacteria]PVE54527.1 general secretion pathway protein GspL [Sphingomonas sp. TPD3009]PVE54761.1 general secretion pathway protein GspL [Arthrobacter sp. TPD3018]PVE82654.1 general secretion pathway protein GspL [Sphingomonas melonis]
MTTLLFLPAGDAPYRWLRLAEDGGIAEGEGLPALPDERIVAVAPAQDLTLHWADLPARSPAQSVAAARLLVAEASATPIHELHVAVGAVEEGNGERPVAVVGSAVMAAWLADLAALGIDPAAMVPAPLLLPRPDEGYLRATVGGAALVRGRTSGFADEARLTDLVVGDAPIDTLPRSALDPVIATAAATPPLDLRQGPFARRRRIGIDWPLVRRLAVMGAGILALTLAIDLVRIGKYSFGADAIDARTEALARTGLPRGETVTDVDRQLAERLSAVRGPGLGFSRTVAAVYAAVRGTPGTELTSLDFQSNGALRIGVGAARESLPTDLKRALEAAGFTVTAGTFQSANGRVTGEMTVTRP